MAVRIKDIAKKVGLSEGSVRKALHGSAGTARISEATKRKILRVARQMRYRPNLIARQLAGGRNRVIGVVVDSSTPEVHFSRVAAIEREISNFGYRLMVGQSLGDVERIRDYLLDFTGRGIDGMLFLSHRGNSPELKSIISEGLSDHSHIVFIGLPLWQDDSQEHYWVDVDRAMGIRQAVEHLTQRGKQRIGMVLRASAANCMTQRHEGYSQAMKQLGRPVEKELIQYPASSSVSPGDLVERIRQPVCTLVREQHVDAILAENDYFAFAAIHQLRQMNLRVPQDIAVVGFDNIEAAGYFSPPLTTIDQNLPQVAKTAIQMLIDAIEEKKIPQKSVILSPTLVIRQST